MQNKNIINLLEGMADCMDTEIIGIPTSDILLDLNGFMLTATDLIVNTDDVLIYGMKSGSKINFSCPCFSMDNFSELSYGIGSGCVRVYGGVYNINATSGVLYWSYSDKIDIRYCTVNFEDNMPANTTRLGQKVIFLTNQSEVSGSTIIGACKNEGVNT